LRSFSSRESSHFTSAIARESDELFNPQRFQSFNFLPRGQFEKDQQSPNSRNVRIAPPRKDDLSQDVLNLFSDLLAGGHSLNPST